MVLNVPKGILDKYNRFALFCYPVHINCIGFLNTIYQHIMVDTGSMIKNRIMRNIEYGIKQVHKLYLQHDFKITHIHADNEFEPLRAEMVDLDISLICASY